VGGKGSKLKNLNKEQLSDTIKSSEFLSNKLNKNADKI